MLSAHDLYRKSDGLRVEEHRRAVANETREAELNERFRQAALRGISTSSKPPPVSSPPKVSASSSSDSSVPKKKKKKVSKEKKKGKASDKNKSKAMKASDSVCAPQLPNQSQSARTLKATLPQDNARGLPFHQKRQGPGLELLL